jgi:hypothetical protein
MRSAKRCVAFHKLTKRLAISISMPLTLGVVPAICTFSRPLRYRSENAPSSPVAASDANELIRQKIMAGLTPAKNP